MAFTFPSFDYLDPMDKQFAQSQLSTSNEIIGSNVAQARARALGRLEQRGLASSGIAEQNLADIEQQGHVARARASGAYDQLLMGIREGNKNRAFQRSIYEDQKKMAQQGFFWDLLGTGISAASMLFPGAGAGSSTALHSFARV